MNRLYTIGIWVYTFAIKAASLFSPKAKEWLQGRSHQAQLIQSFSINQSPIWFHCSSLGEFEQARPIIELIKNHTQEKILLTFFSPSGYLPTKDYEYADWIFYLPADLPQHAKNWIKKFHPKLFILTKYDLWYNYIHTCHHQQIPIILISAIFRPNQYLFKSYARSFRFQLQKFNQIFTQNKETLQLLKKYEFSNVQLTGDTRIDRVSKIAQDSDPIAKIKDFCANKRTIIFGSSWSEEENILIDWLKENNSDDLKYILVPHDVSKGKIEVLKAKIDIPYSLWSSESIDDNHQVLIVDTIGLLNKIYQYGWVAFIGGGFRKSIHNILEPMAQQIPVIIGPNYSNFPEAVEMVESGAVFVVNNYNEFRDTLHKLSNPMIYEDISKTIAHYIKTNQGASQLIFKYLQENNLL